MWLSHLSLSRSTDILLLVITEKACFGILSWGILLTWPNHLSCNLSNEKSRDSTFSELWISELHTLSSKVTPLILRKNLVSDACTLAIAFFRSLPKSPRLMPIGENGNKDGAKYSETVLALWQLNDAKHALQRLFCWFRCSFLHFASCHSLKKLPDHNFS